MLGFPFLSAARNTMDSNVQKKAGLRVWQRQAAWVRTIFHLFIDGDLNDFRGGIRCWDTDQNVDDNIHTDTLSHSTQRTC